MLVRRGEECGVLRDIDPFILQQHLHLPLGRAVDPGLHVQERDGRDAENADRRGDVPVALHAGAGEVRKEDVGRRARQDQRRHPDGPVLVSEQPLAGHDFLVRRIFYDGLDEGQAI